MERVEIADQHARGQMPLRYEDISQDGRPRVTALAVALGVIWRGVKLDEDVRQAMLDRGILPILTRLKIEGFDGPFSIEHPFDVAGSFALAHAKGDRGAVERLFLDMEAEMSAPLGRTNFPAPPGAGTSVAVGTVFAEHVFTRPFAPPSERKILALPIRGTDFVPPRERAQRAPRAVLEIGGDALALDDDYVIEAIPLVMGLTHTDSNQHVNSLVYPALFEEAALRHLARHGRSTSVLARSLEIAYRRPSFAGDTLRIALRLFTRGDAIECRGGFLGPGDTSIDEARAFVRMSLRA
ncbi:hypothetical protein BH09MYX1_BH09MYX1_64460 [soil metagenome]